MDLDCTGNTCAHCNAPTCRLDGGWTETVVRNQETEMACVNAVCPSVNSIAPCS